MESVRNPENGTEIASEMQSGVQLSRGMVRLFMEMLTRLISP
jgi:hypothetical protein